ncbi:MAG: tetraacyldisaccharide 4'-kinase [Desulfuromonadia bacterium]
MNDLIARWHRLTSGEIQGVGDSLLWSGLRFASLCYRLVLGVRSLLYRCGMFRVRRLSRPVISVGNITLGGTGKTPTVLYLARLLQGMGKRVCVLTRGYGGSREGETAVVSDGSTIFFPPPECGDEPYLLAWSLPGLTVVMGSDRYGAGELAIREFSPDIFILDDGFQHRRLHRDLEILLVDGRTPFGNGRLFPAGPLREPVTGGGRADLIMVTRYEGTIPELPPPLHETPLIPSVHHLVGQTILGERDIRPFSELEGKRGIAFAGIASPDRFFDMLEGCGVQLCATVTFPDHTPYGVDELAALGNLKGEKRADFLITTAKDAVKLLPYRHVLANCRVAWMEILLSDPAPLHTEINRLFGG